MTKILSIALFLLLLAIPSFAQNPLDEIVLTDFGGIVTAPGNSIVSLPSPNELGTELLIIRKGDNGSGPVTIRMADGTPIGGWTQLTLAMMGDSCTLVPLIGDYILLSCDSALAGTSGGQHRTPLRSLYPFFNVGPWDRGAVIRYCNDTNQPGNVVLPTAEQAGFVGGGYRNGFRLTIIAVCINAPDVFVAVHAPDSTIHRIGPIVLLTKPFESITLDFDGHEWWIEGHYVPSGEPMLP